MDMDNLQHFCRICATQNNHMQDLFEIVYNGVVLANILEHCLKRAVTVTDGFPRKICSNCKTNLLSTYEFHILCQASEQFFLKRFTSTKSYDEFAKTEKIDDIQNTNESIEGYIKIENDFEFTQTNVENLYFDVKNDDEPLLPISELVCVDENFDARSIIIDENAGPLQSDSEVRQRKPVKTSQSKRMRPHPDEKIFECFECKKRFLQFNEMRQHLIDHDNTRKPFECTSCNVKFTHLTSWFRHRSKHTKNIHQCEYCNMAFSTLTSLKHHIHDMHKDQLKIYKCDLCTEEFPLNFLLARHMEWHKKAKEFKCTTCDAIFFSERKLKGHIRDNHSSHLCAECGKSFKTIHLLASHQMLHTSEKPFACDLCPGRFKWKAALKTHMLVHTGQKLHVCDLCGSSFTTKGSMKKHKRIHTQDRRYQCETCLMRFYSSDHLKRHKRTHTGERPYSCSYCPRSFSQSNDLTKHLRCHVGQNMYRCEHCSESFRLQTELRKHSYTHYNKDDPETLKTE